MLFRSVSLYLKVCKECWQQPVVINNKKEMTEGDFSIWWLKHTLTKMLNEIWITANNDFEHAPVHIVKAHYAHIEDSLKTTTQYMFTTELIFLINNVLRLLQKIAAPLAGLLVGSIIWMNFNA